MNKILTKLEEHDLPQEILEHINIDTDGSTCINLEAIEKLLNKGGSSYADCVLYEEIAELKRLSNCAYTVIEADTQENAYHQILDIYNAGDLSLIELLDHIEIRGLSITNVVEVFAQLCRDIDGDAVKRGEQEHLTLL